MHSASVGGKCGFNSRHGHLMDTKQETLENIGKLVDKINTLKVTLEDELTMLDCNSDEYNALQDYVDALDSAETILGNNINLPGLEWL